MRKLASCPIAHSNGREKLVEYKGNGIHSNVRKNKTNYLKITDIFK